MMKGLTWLCTSRCCYLYLFALFETDRTQLLQHHFAGSDSCEDLSGQCVIKMFAIYYVVSRIAKFHISLAIIIVQKLKRRRLDPLSEQL